MERVILECAPNAQFHIGKIALNDKTSLNKCDDIIHSDTLFSAIINTAAKVADVVEVDTLVELFGKSIFISSCYFYLKNTDTTVYFLPKPISCNLQTSDANFKQIAKIKFISEQVWRKGIVPDDWLDENKCRILQNKFVVTKQEFDALGLNEKSKVYENVLLPKVFVHKKDREDSIYMQANIQITDNTDLGIETGWYFLMDVNENLPEKYNTLLNKALFLMASEGIGGERSTGCGWIKEVRRNNTFDAFATYNDFVNSGCVVSVALYNPNPDANKEVPFEMYNLITRGGRATRDKGVLPRVKCLAEGAVANANTKIEGSSVILASKKIRYAHPFLLPLHENFSKNLKDI